MRLRKIPIWLGLSDLDSVRRYLGYVKPFRRLLIASGALLLLATALQLSMPVLTGLIIDRILIEKRPAILNYIVLLLICLSAAYLSTNFVRIFLLLRIKIKIYLQLQRQLLGHINRLSFTYSSRKQTGYLASRVLDDPNQVNEIAVENILTFVQHSLTFLVAVLVMAWLNWQAALCSILVIPIYILVGASYIQKLRDLSAASIEKQAQFSRLLHEQLAGLYTINACGAEAQTMRRFCHAQKENVHAQLKQFLLSSKIATARNFIAGLGPLVVLWYSGMLVIKGRLSIGQLVTFSAVFGYLFNSAQSLSAMHLSLQKAVVCLKRIFEILDRKPLIEEQQQTSRLIELQEAIEFSNVSFSYDQIHQVLRRINLWFPAGQSIALVGPSGAGKTTIAHLLMRFYEPTSGSILLDGEDLQSFSIRSLRRRIAIVPQDVFLFSMTVKQNICLGHGSATDEEVISAAKRANAHEFIQALPEGYQTIIGERGMTLSGGQRQRLAIARALLKKPEVLILDEATSSVDSVSEGLICGAIEHLASVGRITTIIIAHHLSTIRKADLIYFIADGQVIGKGGHEMLLMCCPPYRELIELQFGPAGYERSGNAVAV